jgi:hypothetical protein
MSKPAPRPETSSPFGEVVGAFLESVCKTAVWVGLAGMAIGLGFLIYTFSVVGGGSASGVNAAQVASNIDLFSKILLGGTLAVILSLTFLYWGEETLGVLQLVGAGLLYFAPILLPQAFGVSTPSPEGAAALGAIQVSGTVAGGIAIVVLLSDLAVRIRLRSLQGARADALKYGKGIKEERDIQNVFMGKCWQLPFCRKFVRERCPIYHARRTCWKEQVGCMCEEQVIRDAMEGKVIPKDSVAAAQFIPRNNRLTGAQKFERCKQCVIYNEHQKHKYRAWLPAVGIAFVGLYILLRGPLLIATGGLISSIDRMIGRATFRSSSGVSNTIQQSGLPFEEILLVCFMIIAFAYVLRLMEYLVFKLKV